jgi:integrase
MTAFVSENHAVGRSPTSPPVRRRCQGVCFLRRARSRATANRQRPEAPPEFGDRLPVRESRRLRPRTSSLLRELLRATAAAPSFQGLEGTERALVYRVALETGLRANEIRSLRTASFQGLDTNEPTATLHAAASKHRREDTLPLRVDLARELRELAAHVRA